MHRLNREISNWSLAAGHRARRRKRAFVPTFPANSTGATVLFLEKVSPAIEPVDSSSGSIGTAVNQAVDTLVSIIAAAPAEPATRNRWLERLWQAYQDDEIPYLESLGDCWGALCASKEVASHWADELLPTCRLAWSPDPKLRGYFKGTACGLSALLVADRHQDVLDLLDRAPYPIWHYRQYGVKALAAMGRPTDAIEYAEGRRGLNDSPVAIAAACEAVLIASGQFEDAYRRYGLVANRAGTYLAWFRAIARKYPSKAPAQILADLVAHTPGDEGKWFAAAKDAGLFEEAIALVNRTPSSPQTLTRAARDFTEKNPGFAVHAGFAALRWLVAGHGYDVTSQDVRDAYDHTMKAAHNLGRADEIGGQIRALVAT